MPNSAHNKRINDNNYEIDYTRSLTMECTAHCVMLQRRHRCCRRSRRLSFFTVKRATKTTSSKGFRKNILLRWIMCINCRTASSRRMRQEKISKEENKRHKYRVHWTHRSRAHTLLLLGQSTFVYRIVLFRQIDFSTAIYRLNAKVFSNKIVKRAVDANMNKEHGGEREREPTNKRCWGVGGWVRTRESEREREKEGGRESERSREKRRRGEKERSEEWEAI